MSKNTTTNQVTDIYEGLVSIASGCKNGKINQSELIEKYLKFHPSNVKNEVVARLNDSGYITRTSDTPPLLVEFKREWDANGLESLQKNGSYTYTPSDPKLLESIVNDPNANSDKLFVETPWKNVDGGHDIFHPTINNSNESSRRIRVEQNGKLKS